MALSTESLEEKQLAAKYGNEKVAIEEMKEMKAWRRLFSYAWPKA